MGASLKRLQEIVQSAIQRKCVPQCHLCKHSIDWHTNLGCRWGASRKGKRRKKCFCKMLRRRLS